MSEGFKRAAQARRLFMHVENGGQLKPYDVAGMVRAIEELETECHTLLAERDELRQALKQARGAALDKAHIEIDVFLRDQAASKGGTKTPQGRTASWYRRQLKDRIRALQSTTTKEEE